MHRAGKSALVSVTENLETVSNPLGSCQTATAFAAPHILHLRYTGLPFPHVLPTLGAFSLSKQPDRTKVVSHCVCFFFFILYYPRLALELMEICLPPWLSTQTMTPHPVPLWFSFMLLIFVRKCLLNLPVSNLIL